MSRFNFNRALGDDMSPFAPDKDRIAPVVLGAIIAGGATLAATAGSTIMNALSNKSTNETNMAMNENQLANQRLIHDQDIIENRRLVDQAYERNLPINQVKNLKEAGINPAFAMDSGSFGMSQAQSGSVPSAPSSGTMHPAQSMDYSGLGVGVSQAANIVANGIIQAKEQDRADYALASDIQVQHMNARSNMMNAFTKAKEAGVNEKWLERQWEEMNRRYWLDVDQNSNEKEDKAIQRSLEEKTVEVAQFKAETERMATQSGIKLNDASISELYNQCQKLQEEVVQMRKKGSDESKIANYVARQQKATAEKLERENERGKRNDLPGVRQKYQDFTEWLFTPIKGLISIGGKL